MSKHFETVKVTMTDSERIEIGNRIVQLELEIERLEDEKSEFTSSINANIKTKEKEILDLSKNYLEGKIERECECVWIPDDPSPLKKTLYAILEDGSHEKIRTEEMNIFDSPANGNGKSNLEDIINSANKNGDNLPARIEGREYKEPEHQDASFEVVENERDAELVDIAISKPGKKKKSASPKKGGKSNGNRVKK